MLDASCSRLAMLVTAALVASACGDTEDHLKFASPSSGGAGAAGGGGGAGGSGGSEPMVPISVTLTARNHGQPVDLAFAAFQDGDLPWQPLVGEDGFYDFQVTQGRYGITWVCASAIATRVFLLTTDDATELTVACPEPRDDLLYLTGNLSGVAADRCAFVNAGEYTTYPDGPGGGAYALGMAKGTHDLIAWEGASAMFPGPPPCGQTVDAKRVIRKSDVVMEEAASIDFDFDAESTETEKHTMPFVSAAGGGSPYVHTEFWSKLGTVSRFYMKESGFVTSMPPSLLEPGDLHRIFGSRYDESTGVNLTVDAWTDAVADGELDAPSPPPTPKISAGSQDRPHASFETVPGATGYLFSASVCAGDAHMIFATPGWLSDGSTVELEFPVVEHLPGWSSEWSSYGNASSGGYYFWEIGVVTSNLGTSTLYPPDLEKHGVAGLGEDGLVMTTARVLGAECPGI